MRRPREAVVLAGGFGTRLAAEVPGIPKPMAPVAGRPFLRYVLDLLDGNAFGHVVIADGYLREQVEGYFGSRYRGLAVSYSPEEEPLGTGGALRRALGLCRNGEVFVLNGDTYCEPDFPAMERTLTGREAVLATVEVPDASRYGTVEAGPDGTLLAFREKEDGAAGMASAGCYLLRGGSLDGMPERFSLEQGWLRPMAGAGSLAAVPAGGTFVDIGVPDDYRRAQKLLAPLARSWRLAMFDRDGTLNADTGHLHDPGELELLEEGCGILRGYSAREGWKTVVLTNQSGIARGLYGEAEMDAVHAALDGLLGERGARVDAYYHCPHHPDFTGPCGCRKPAPGMLLAAMRDYDAEPPECVFFGDKESDRLAAEAAGVPFRPVGEIS